MYIERLYTHCLAHAAYYIESSGEAAVIDPLRDPQPYLDLAAKRKARFKYVFETHFHADFVSGHVDLARLTGAAIVYGPGARPAYEAVIGMDGERFQLGEIAIELLHTPGHTVESSCFLLKDRDDRPYCVFTGDTLFIGDVGRPDLLSGNLTKEELASKLYDSLNKLKVLPEDVLVYPGHGAGSACGKNIGSEAYSTIGKERRTNYALANMSQKEFVSAVTSGLPVPPAYFFKDAALNVDGITAYAEVFAQANRKLTPGELSRKAEQGCLLLDTRASEEFGSGFIPGSVNIGLNGDLAVWVGTLVPFGSEIALVAEPGKEEEVIRRLMRVGYDNIAGYLDGGIEAWKQARLPLDQIRTLSATEAQDTVRSDQFIILDVRKPSEVAKYRVKGSVHAPLSELNGIMDKFGVDQKFMVYCAGGYRSMIAASLLKAKGIAEVLNVDGGINKIRFECPELVVE